MVNFGAMNLKAQIPNAITLGNLLCGVFSIYATSQDRLGLASILILAGAGFDFFDGFAARLLKVSGEMGKQLDSLADLISFGLAPTFIAMHLCGAFDPDPVWIAFLPAIIAPFAAYRLAKFNLDTRQSVDFIGLATPSNALIWISFPIVAVYGDRDGMVGEVLAAFSGSQAAIIILSLVLSFLMVSEIRFFSLKFSSFGWSPNKFRYILIASAIPLLLLFGLAAIPIILLLYLLLSVIKNIIPS